MAKIYYDGEIKIVDHGKWQEWIFADGSPEAREQAKWCSEYMPEASRSECAAEAGW